MVFFPVLSSEGSFNFLWFYSVVFVERHFTVGVCVCVCRRKSKVVSDKAAIVSVPEMKCCVFEST